MFVYNPYDQSVEMYDTSRKVITGKKIKTRYTKSFPFECESSYDYFKLLYEKSLKFEEDNDIYFIGWVNPNSVMPVSEMPKRKIKKEIRNYDEITKQLRSKHKEFCLTIGDWKMRKLFRKHTYIAGGAIASLIRGEEPKDYDIFFDDSCALKQILKYYVDKHNEMYTGTTKHYEIKMNFTEDRTSLILNSPYVKSSDEDNKEMNPVVFSATAVSFPRGYQLIIDSDNEESKSVDRFDYVHTMGYFHPFRNKLEVKDETLRAIKEHKLIYNAQGNNPIGSAKRLLRFVARGWEIDNKEHVKLLRNIHRIDSEQSFGMEELEYHF